jgi:ADP-heptose:LPS heptosyltransferase
LGSHVTERVLIVHQGAIGDFICCLPALACLRQALSDAHITLLGYPRVLEIAVERYYAESVLSIDRADMALLYQEGEAYPADFRALFEGFRRIGVFGSDNGPFSRNLEELSRAPVTVARPFPPEGSGIHMVDHALSLVRSMGFPVHRDCPRLHLLAKERHEAVAFLNHHGVTRDDPVIAIHPGSGSQKKMWPLERFLTLAEGLATAHGGQILFVVGPGEEHIKERLFTMIRGKPWFVLSGLSLPLLGAILEQACVFVGNDSGISHMAAAVGVPVVTLFGPTDPVVWAPLGGDVTVIRRSLPCSPCDRRTMAQCEHQRCLMGISVKEVRQAVKRVIEGTQYRHLDSQVDRAILNRESGAAAPVTS